MKATAISRSAWRRRASPVLDSSQITTTEAPISIKLSRPKPARATERAARAVSARTRTPTTFQARVAYSSRNPRQRRLDRLALVAADKVVSVADASDPDQEVPLGDQRG